MSDQPTSKDMKWLTWCASGAPIFSTCSKGKYFAIITDITGRVAGTGYNGGPAGTQHCIDGGCPRAVNGVPSGTPYDYGPGFCIAIHAEMNALLYSEVGRRRGGTLYVNGTPCVGCAKAIANSGISRVVFSHDERLGMVESEEILSGAGITVIPVRVN